LTEEVNSHETLRAAQRIKLKLLWTTQWEEERLLTCHLQQCTTHADLWGQGRANSLKLATSWQLILHIIA